jgi:PhnB protein
MRFITIFRSKTAPSGPPKPEHIAQMQEEIGKLVSAGKMVTTGGIGIRAATGGRVTNEGGKISVEAPPQGDGGWMAAGGFSILNADSREQVVEQVKKQLQFMGEGTVEFCEYKQFYPAADQTIAPPSAAQQLPGGVVPYLSFDGAAEVIEFYKKAFGAKEITRMFGQDGKKIMHCQLEINGGGLMLADNFPEYGMGAVQRSASYVMQLVLADGDAWWDRAVKAGCTPRMPFEIAPWGDKYGQLSDPFGVTWAINMPAKK